MKIKVFKEGLDWTWVCEEHEQSCWTDGWDVAWEGAMGHACMHHPTQPYQDLIRTLRNARTCIDCLGPTNRWEMDVFDWLCETCASVRWP